LAAKPLSLDLEFELVDDRFEALIAIGTADLLVRVASISMLLNGTSSMSVAQLGVGTDVSLSLVEDQVLLTQGNAYCVNCDVYNKESDETLCDHHERPEANVLSYSLGPLAGFQREIRQRQRRNDSSITLACSTNILRGTYDLGSRPHSALFSLGGAFGLVAVHEGLQPSFPARNHSGISSSGRCGAPLPHRGLVVDAWPIHRLLSTTDSTHSAPEILPF